MYSQIEGVENTVPYTTPRTDTVSRFDIPSQKLPSAVLVKRDCDLQRAV